MSWRHPREMLSLYIDEALTREQKEKVDQHLAKCTQCNKFYDRLLKMHQELHQIPQPLLPTYLVSGVMARYRQLQKRPTFWSSFDFVPKLLQPAALVLILLIALLLAWPANQESAQNQIVKTYASVYEASVTWPTLSSDEEALQYALNDPPKSLQGER
jgi:predicted anti-sigma-YlaC factor YlaD